MLSIVTYCCCVENDNNCRGNIASYSCCLYSVAFQYFFTIICIFGILSRFFYLFLYCFAAVFVLLALVISRLRYALPKLPAWSSFLKTEQIGQINAFLKRLYKYVFVLNQCI